MLFDRGSKKWGSLMLLEHFSKVENDMNKEAHKRLDEWDLEDIQKTISQAAERQQIITLMVCESDRYSRL